VDPFTGNVLHEKVPRQQVLLKWNIFDIQNPLMQERCLPLAIHMNHHMWHTESFQRMVSCMTLYQ
jgi:hypothetical protein